MAGLKSHARPAVAVTGLGVICSIGRDLDEFAAGLFAGRCGIGPVSVFDVSGFPARQAAQVRDLPVLDEPGSKDWRRISRCDRLGLLAAEMALADAGLKGGGRIGVVLGGGAGGLLSWELFRQRLDAGTRRGPAPAPLLSCTCSSLADLVAARFDLTGFRATVATACSSSATAIGLARDLVLGRDHQVVITGGSEALSMVTFAGFNALKVMDPEPCRPFDKNRRGLCLGEAAAVLVLEDYQHALARGARIRAQVLGYATTADAYHMTTPDPEALGMSRAMVLALEDSGVDPGQVDYVNAHGTGTRTNDPLEALALKKAFGPSGVADLAVSSTKSMLGHCLGAAGAIEAAATILALEHQVLPPTIGLQEPDPACDLNHVAGKSRPCRLDVAVSNSFAFGGNNTCLVLARADYGRE